MATGDRVEQLAERAERVDEGRLLSLVQLLLSGAIAAAVLSPALWILLRATSIPTDGVVSLLVDPSTLQVLVNSVLLVVVVTVASTLLGVPLALLTVRTDLPFPRFWTVAVSLPLVVPSYIGAFAYVSAFGPRGQFADLLAPLGVESIPSIYGFGGTTLVLTLYVYPYVFLTTRAALLSFDDTLAEAARTLNHTRWEAFRRVTLPQITPGITAGALLVALYTLSDFGTPAIMQFDVFTRTIYVEYTNFGRDTAALLSIQLMVVTAVILAVESRIGTGDADAYASRRTRESKTGRLGALRYPAMAFPALVVGVSLLVPIVVLFVWLLRAGPGYAAGGFAFEWSYGLNSALVSVLAALAAVLAALPVAYFSARSSSRVARLFERATYVGYAMPGVVLGLALVYFGSNYAPVVYQALPLLVFAYVVRFMPQAVGATRSSLLQVDPKLTEAARTLNETTIGAFRRITLPLIAPGVVAGAALVFLTTMKELPATLLLHPTGFKTLVTHIWLVQEAGYYGRAALPALVLVGLSAVSMLVLLTQEGNDVT